jgi:hypothetical protein
MVANPITYTEVEAWSRLTRTFPTPWEVSALMRIDDAVLAAQSRPDVKKAPTVQSSEGTGVAMILRDLAPRSRPKTPPRKAH